MFTVTYSPPKIQKWVCHAGVEGVIVPYGLPLKHCAFKPALFRKEKQKNIIAMIPAPQIFDFIVSYKLFIVIVLLS
jgi:hypothetical protein